MLVVHVSVTVKPEQVEAFKLATIRNAEASRLEPGVARFDVVQSLTDPTRFVLIEAYRHPDAPALHKQSKHYEVWRDTVESMMQGPRVSERYESVSPDASEWS